MNVATDPPALPAGVQRSFNDHWIAIAFQRLVDWFVPAAYAEIPHLRQHTHVFAGSLLASAPVTFGLGLVAFWVVPPQFASLPWVVLLTMGFALFPLLVKWSGRLDIVAVALVQAVSLGVLAIAHFYGGLVSPALPWLMIALTTSFYYLAPWPLWRNLNLALFAAEVIAFVVLEIDFGPATQTVSDRALLIMLFCSSVAVFVFMQFVLLLVWSMNLAKQRQLKSEVAVRKEAESELRVGRDHLARAQAVGRIGSAEHDPETHATKWSSEHYRLLGLAPDTPGPVADLLLAAVHPDDRESVAALLERERHGMLTPPTEFRILRPDGAVRWLRRQPELIRNAGGGMISLFVTVQDITEWKESHEDRVSLERQLLQSQKLEEIGKLAGGVAQDFNNLLAVIMGRLEMVEEELIDRPEVRDWVVSAMRAAERGKNLTKMILSFARRQPLQPQQIDPAIVVGDLTEMLRRTLGEAIEIKLESAPDQWRCEVDPAQLQSAVLNLAVNAREAMPGGGILTITTGNFHLDVGSAPPVAGAEPGDYVVLAVADNGMGMRADIAERAFEPFFTTKDVGRGSGLGLSMVGGFVAQSGGHVVLDSQIGRGTTVTMYLPCHRSPEADAGESDKNRQSPPARRESILVVEDNDEFRDLTKQKLERLGYTVVTGATGAEGLERLRRHPEVALLLCDIVLTGGIDGVEVAKRATAAKAGLKVIFMSGYTTHTGLPAFGPNGTPRLLRKPFHGEELAEEIRMALDESRDSRPRPLTSK